MTLWRIRHGFDTTVEAATAPSGPERCTKCGHPSTTHANESTMGGPDERCLLLTCDCPAFVPPRSEGTDPRPITSSD